MPIEYINRSGAKYHLHVSATKTGKPKYYVALHARGPLADAIPDGFEIYESPKGHVSLRKILPKLIFDEELIFVEREVARIARLKGSQVERKLKILFLRSLRIARITPEQLKAELDSGTDLVIVDLRHALEDEAEPRTLPGALRLPAEKLEERGGELPHGKTLVLYCSHRSY